MHRDKCVKFDKVWAHITKDQLPHIYVPES